MNQEELAKIIKNLDNRLTDLERARQIYNGDWYDLDVSNFTFDENELYLLNSSLSIKNFLNPGRKIRIKKQGQDDWEYGFFYQAFYFGADLAKMYNIKVNSGETVERLQVAINSNPLGFPAQLKFEANLAYVMEEFYDAFGNLNYTFVDYATKAQVLYRSSALIPINNLILIYDFVDVRILETIDKLKFYLEPPAGWTSSISYYGNEYLAWRASFRRYIGSSPVDYDGRMYIVPVASLLDAGQVIEYKMPAGNNFLAGQDYYIESRFYYFID